MISVGLNGFGRIGKCIFLQLIHNKSIEIKVINAPDFDINKLESYLKFDSVHKYSNDFIIEIIDNNSFKINNKLVYILRNRDAKQLNWRDYEINHIIDATGVYLTQEKAKQQTNLESSQKKNKQTKHLINYQFLDRKISILEA